MSVGIEREVVEYLVARQLSGVIRIPDDEYAGIPKEGELAHFNLEQTPAEVGKCYALARIVKHGHSAADGTEVLPTLSFINIYHGEVLEVRNNLSYDELTPKDFEHSMTHIQNVEELKATILKRYKISKPDLSEKEILSRGVSRMLLKLHPAR